MTAEETAVDARGIIEACPACGKRNRIPFERLGQAGECGNCHQPLPAAAVPIEIDRSETFERMVANSALPVVVDFWAPWCGPCRMVAPEIEKVAAANPGRFLVAKVNTEALPEIGGHYQISSIPTMAVFAGGREVARTSGARPASAIESFVRQAIDGT